ncbi:MAG: MauE/DoxX family redox-associated membrane protein [Acidobacteriota bacterium]
MKTPAFTASVLKVATHRYVALAFRLYLGCLFIYASMYKINYAAEFAESIAAYQLVPYWGVNVMTLVMPWLELICGILLVAGIKSKSAVTVIGGLLALFSITVLVTLLRDIPIGCGCFSSVEEPMTPLTLLRDLVWLAMSIHVYFFDAALHLERGPAVTLKDVPL